MVGAAKGPVGPAGRGERVAKYNRLIEVEAHTDLPCSRA
jgi:enolase